MDAPSDVNAKAVTVPYFAPGVFLCIWVLRAGGGKKKVVSGFETVATPEFPSRTGLVTAAVW